jgi:hypothetical protein
LPSISNFSPFVVGKPVPPVLEVVVEVVLVVVEVVLVVVELVLVVLVDVVDALVVSVVVVPPFDAAKVRG